MKIERKLFCFLSLCYYLLIKISMTGCAAVSTWGILYTHSTWQVWLIWFSVYSPVNHLFSYYKVAQLCSISHWKLAWQVIVRHLPGRVCRLAKDASRADRLPCVWQLVLLVSLPECPWSRQWYSCLLVVGTLWQETESTSSASNIL